MKPKNITTVVSTLNITASIKYVYLLLKTIFKESKPFCAEKYSPSYNQTEKFKKPLTLLIY